MPKVSIIVPIYNKEKFLDHFLKDLMKQTLKDIEIILVDDGSQDNSLEIINSFQKENKRVRIIAQKNQGVSVARNIGIENASGDYVAFADPDDRLAPDMLQKMYEKCLETEAPVAIANYYQETKKAVIKRELKTSKEVLNKEDIYNEILSKMIGPLTIDEETIMASVWRLLIKREIIIDNNITFPKGIHRMQDLAFSIELFINIDKVCVVKDHLYYYKVHDDSATSVYDVNTFDQLIRVLPIIEDILNEYKIKDSTIQKRMNNRYLFIGMKSISNEAKSTNPNTYSEASKAITDICKHEKVQKALADIDFRQYPFKQRVVLNAIRKNHSGILFSYYRLAQILFH